MRFNWTAPFNFSRIYLKKKYMLNRQPQCLSCTGLPSALKWGRSSSIYMPGASVHHAALKAELAIYAKAVSFIPEMNMALKYQSQASGVTSLIIFSMFLAVILSNRPQASVERTLRCEHGTQDTSPWYYLIQQRRLASWPSCSTSWSNLNISAPSKPQSEEFPKPRIKHFSLLTTPNFTGSPW